MKRIVKAGIAGILLAAATSSASAIEVWQGNLFITAANNACNGTPWTVNTFFTAVYRPSGLSNNGGSTRLALFLTRYAATYAVSGALSGNGQYQATRITPAASVFDWSGTYAKASVKPASPTATTKTVVVKVQLAKFGNTGKCKVTLQGSLGKRPDDP